MLAKLSKKEAKLLNQKFYFTNKPCKYSHLCERWVSTGACKTCHEQQYWKNKEARLKYSRDYYKTHKKEKALSTKKWSENNREKRNQYNKKWRNNNKEYLKIWKKKYRKIKFQDPLFRLNNATSAAIWRCLKKDKNWTHWEDLVPFSLLELKSHLESKFEDWMTWENYGEWKKDKKTWQLDHIKPISLCKDFEEIWQLSNLQPLESIKNTRKGNRYIG